MKRLLAIIALALLMCGGCGLFPQEEPIPQQDIPCLSPGQVIEIVRGRYPDCSREDYMTGRTTVRASSITVEYLGNGVWEATITCPPLYRQSDGWGIRHMRIIEKRSD